MLINAIALFRAFCLHFLGLDIREIREYWERSVVLIKGLQNSHTLGLFDRIASGPSPPELSGRFCPSLRSTSKWVVSAL